jgi:tetratricopeptide (TPR) repeat protein
LSPAELCVYTNAMKTFLASCLFLIRATPLPAETVDVFAQAMTHQREGRLSAALEGFLLFISESPDRARADQALRQIWNISNAVKQQEEKLRFSKEEWEESVRRAHVLVDKRREEAKRLMGELQLLAKGLNGDGDPLSSLRRSGLSSSAAIAPEAMSGWAESEAAQYMDSIRKSLQKVISSPTGNPADLHEAKGYFWLFQGDWELAVKEWREALERRPRDEALKKKLEDIEARWLEQKNKDNADHEFDLALGDFQVGNYKRARERFDSALKLAPDNAEARRYLALAETALFKVKQQEKVQEFALEARRKEQAGKMLESIQAWVDVLTLDPDNREARRSLEKARRRLSASSDGPAVSPEPQRPAKEGDRPVSEAAAQRAEETYSLGLIQYANGNLKEAKALFGKALALDPGAKKILRAWEQVLNELGEDR